MEQIRNCRRSHACARAHFTRLPWDWRSVKKGLRSWNTADDPHLLPLPQTERCPLAESPLRQPPSAADKCPAKPRRSSGAARLLLSAPSSPAANARIPQGCAGRQDAARDSERRRCSWRWSSRRRHFRRRHRHVLNPRRESARRDGRPPSCQDEEAEDHPAGVCHESGLFHHGHRLLQQQPEARWALAVPSAKSYLNVWNNRTWKLKWNAAILKNQVMCAKWYSWFHQIPSTPTLGINPQFAYMEMCH